MNSSKSEVDLDRPNVEEYLTDAHLDGTLQPGRKLLLRDLLDISPALNEAASAIVDDSFTRCFKSNPPETWNWNLYLFPLWCFGLLVRYLILFPIRVALLVAGWVIFLSLFIPVHFVLKDQDKIRHQLERVLVEFMCSVFVASWTGVVKYHGPRPSVRPRQVFVANHTSMIDFIILEQMTAFAVIMQKHPGWVGLLQSTVFKSLGCIWFNRTEAKDRHIVSEKIKQHIEGHDNNPLLIFPEGTCVNNHYTVMFKKRGLVEFMCSVFVASWTGVIKYHGPRPSVRPRQKHPGWVGLLQSTILESLGCIWFNRTEAKDRHIVSEKIKQHIEGPDNNPLLIFPEGTCVNNQYTVMFKKGAFELGCTVCPIAIKYNKIFVDAFWNSKKQSFTMHLVRLMTSWAVVCDVWYLEPQTLQPGETPIEFAERVRDIISMRAGIKKVPWDGYLKYYRPSPKLTESKQKCFAEAMLWRLEDK